MKFSVGDKVAVCRWNYKTVGPIEVVKVTKTTCTTEDGQRWLANGRAHGSSSSRHSHHCPEIEIFNQAHAKQIEEQDRQRASYAAVRKLTSYEDSLTQTEAATVLEIVEAIKQRNNKKPL